MDFLLPLILATLVSAEELRFSAASEQGFESSCGLAAAVSLLSLYCGLPATEAELSRARAWSGGASLGELLELLPAWGLRARAFRLGLPELDEALARGFAPALLHYDRPKGHFALLLGGRGGVYVAADPGRGLESLSGRELEGRWSGAAILIDPAFLSQEGLALRDEALASALGKRRLLAESALAEWGLGGGGEGGAGVPGPGADGERQGLGSRRERLGFRGIGLRRLGLGLELELQPLERGLRLGLGLGQELGLASGLSFGLDLPLELGLGTEPSYVLPAALALRLGYSRVLAPWLLGARLRLELPTALGFSAGYLRPEGQFGFGLGFDAARILDPASLGASLDLGLWLPGRGASAELPPQLSLGLGLSATEALNETLYLSARASLGFGWRPGLGELSASVEIGGVVGVRMGDFGARLGGSSSRSAESGPPLSLGLSWDFGADRSRRKRRRTFRPGRERRGLANR